MLLLIFIRTIPSSKAFCCTALFHLKLYVQSKQLRSCQDGQLLLKPHCSWASLPVAVNQYKVSILLPVTDNLFFLNQRKREYFSSCQDGQLLFKPHCSWASLPVAVYQYKVSILLPVTDNLFFLNQWKREYFSSCQDGQLLLKPHCSWASLQMQFTSIKCPFFCQ